MKVFIPTLFIAVLVITFTIALLNPEEVFINSILEMTQASLETAKDWFNQALHSTTTTPQLNVDKLHMAYHHAQSEMNKTYTGSSLIIFKFVAGVLFIALTVAELSYIYHLLRRTKTE